MGMQQPRLLFFASAVLLVAASQVLVLGCDSSQRDSTTVAVHGQVLLDGVPLAGARVTLIPISEIDDPSFDIKPMSYGVTDSEGNFNLQQADGTLGAAKGQHAVMISKPIDLDNAQFSLEAKANAVPEFYRRYGYLKRHVMSLSGSQRLNFKLSSIDPLLKE